MTKAILGEIKRSRVKLSQVLKTSGYAWKIEMGFVEESTTDLGWCDLKCFCSPGMRSS